MPICGPKLSIFCLLVSGWAIIQLPIMGLMLHKKNFAFVEDMEIHGENKTSFFDEIDAQYEAAAQSCWIASGLYVVTFLAALQQFCANKA